MLSFHEPCVLSMTLEQLKCLFKIINRQTEKLVTNKLHMHKEYAINVAETKLYESISHMNAEQHAVSLPQLSLLLLLSLLSVFFKTY